MKYITLFWEILIFIPVLVLLFFVNPDKVWDYHILWYLVDFVYHYFSFFSKQQIFIWFLFVIAFFIQEIIWWAIKFFFFKDRPNPMKWTNWFEKVMAWSFPSLHSARTFLLFLFALFYTNVYVALWFFFFWALIAYSRIHLKKHFYVDLIGGIVLAIFTFFITIYVFW